MDRELKTSGKVLATAVLLTLGQYSVDAQDISTYSELKSGAQLGNVVITASLGGYTSPAATTL